MTDSSYAHTIAGDLLRMLTAAKEQGVNVDAGFRNQALSSPGLTLTYLFLSKNDLLKVPALPAQVKKLVRRSNALATLEITDGTGSTQTVGVHLIWSSAKACSAIESEAEMRQGILVQGLAAYTNQLKTLLRTDIARTTSEHTPAE
ncbi:hypothetical protein MASR1M90_10740 [Desulfovibrionales bacterium]